MSSQNFKSLESFPPLIQDSVQSQVTYGFTLSEENPFEEKLLRCLRDRVPVKVGRLRYAVGSGLISELLLRGAEALESEYPGALGLQDLLGPEPAPSPALPGQAVPSAKGPCCDDVRILSEEKTLTGERIQPVFKEKNAEKSGAPPKNSSGSFLDSSEVPRLNLSGFDFGSSPV